jgi:Rrf2 family iron-sulfur cluster assembly transcriptional regulator
MRRHYQEAAKKPRLVILDISDATIMVPSSCARGTSMLKVSNKGRYAVRALFDLAFHRDERPAQLRDIAERQRIPLRFLEQIFQDLKRARLVDSKRGPRGGYQLARPAGEIRVGDALRALEGPIALVAESSPSEPSRSASRARTSAKRAPEADWRQVTDAVFSDLARDVERCFDAVTLEDLCARGEAMGLRRRARPLVAAYVI